MKRADGIVKRILVTALGVAVSALLVASAPPAGKAVPKQPPASLPRLVDLGAGKCIPCKKMAPIIEEMQEDYAAIVDIVFLDVWKNPKAGTPYKIRLIPTQVFFDREGREVYRHEGFMPREEIEKIFQEKMGVTPVKPAAKVPKSEAGTDHPPNQNARG
jgi:thioredoxin 1